MPDRCAPTTAIAISSFAARRQLAASAGCHALGADRSAGIRMKHAADTGERGVRACRRQQRDAEGNAVVAHRGRQREAAEVEQIDEIGVGAEPAVEFDRIGQHLRGGIGGRRGRQHDGVDIGEGARRRSPRSGCSR